MSELTERLERFENRLRSMETELFELRRLACELDPEPEPEPQFVWSTPTEPEPVRLPAPEPEVAHAPPLERIQIDLDWSALFGARALAWTGGAVMLLGIVFFFVLAVERGWIGPVTRVSLGALASAICLGAAYAVRRRVGDTYASVSAAGVGIAGFYATLLAATALYHLVPRPVALVAAAAIAAVGAALAILWSSQTLASLGLLGAALVPIAIAIQNDRLSAIGTAFAVLVLAATALVTIPRAWSTLYVIATLAVTIEAFVIVVDQHSNATAVVAVSLWLVSAGAALWLALRARMTYLPATMLTLSAVFSGWSAAVQYDGNARGYALLIVAGAYGLASIVLWRRDRNAAAVLWAIALTVAAVGAAVLTSGLTLTIVWAAEAAALARLAKRLDEPRFQLAALGWLALAYVHGISVDAPFSKLFELNDDTWRAAISAGSLAVGTAIVALSTFEWEPREEGVLAPVLGALRDAQRDLRRVAYALAGGAALYGGSLFVVTIPDSWSSGHELVAALWSAVAVALVFTPVRRAALIVVAGAAVLVLAYDLHWVGEPQRWWSFALVAAAAAVVAIVDTVDNESFTMLVISAPLATAATAELLDGHTRGYGLLALGAAYAAVGVAVLSRRRNFASALGGVGLLLAIPASIILLDRTWLVLAWAAAAIGLTLLARYEERLLYAAVTYFGLAFLHMLTFEARPNGLFVAHRHPGSGIAAVVLVLAAAAVLAWRSELLRRGATWLCGALALYAVTLALLELFEDTGTGVDATFQRGHTAVSVVWGIVGLGLLVAGLKRSGRHLRLGGLVLFGLSLVKLFFYDLANLSSVARALSFLGVGALLLVGGFFYQRLAGGDVDSLA